MIICKIIIIYLELDKTNACQTKKSIFWYISVNLSDLYVSWRQPQ